MKLYNSLKTLILEVASLGAVRDAISKKNKCIIYYIGDEPGGKGLREIEPVCLGYSKSGNLVLRAWDYEGASHTAYKGKQPLPGWRLFRLDKITMFRPTEDNFFDPRPNYNFNGDRSMTKVLINAQFDQTA
jgi:predicted DNA-binding transcriptional regulator YafY